MKMRVPPKWRIRIHDLRHSHASLLVEKNVPIIAISERLGHEDVQTTLNTYSHLYPYHYVLGSYLGSGYGSSRRFV